MSRPCPREPDQPGRRALTARQAAVLDAMIAFLLERQRLPTYEEIGAVFGFNKHAAWCHCTALIHKGHLAKDGPNLRVLLDSDRRPFAIVRNAQPGGKE